MPPLVTLPASPAVHRRDLPALLTTLLAGALCVAAQRSATASAADSTSGAIALPISTIDATRSGS